MSDLTKLFFRQLSCEPKCNCLIRNGHNDQSVPSLFSTPRWWWRDRYFHPYIWARLVTCWYCCREHDPFLSSSWRYENQNGDWDGEPEFGGEVVSTGEWQDSVSGFLSRKTTPKEEVNYYDDDGDAHWGGKKSSQDDASYRSLPPRLSA